MRVTETYDEVKAHATRTGPCPECGRKTRRSRTFTMTVSPFNKAPGADRPRTYREVQDAVEAKAAAWDPPADLFRHASH